MSIVRPWRRRATGLVAQSQSLIKDVQLVVVEGGPHAIAWTHADQVNTPVLEFLRS